MHLRAVITGRSKEEINGHRFTILQCKFLDLNYISVKFILCRESTKSKFGLLVCPHSSHWCQGESGNRKNKVPVTHGSSDISIIGTRRIKCRYKLKWEHMEYCMGTAIISVNPAEFPQGIIWPSIFAFKYRGKKTKRIKEVKVNEDIMKRDNCLCCTTSTGEEHVGRTEELHSILLSIPSSAFNSVKCQFDRAGGENYT